MEKFVMASAFEMSQVLVVNVMDSLLPLLRDGFSGAYSLIFSNG